MGVLWLANQLPELVVTANHVLFITQLICGGLAETQLFSGFTYDTLVL
jgi:hypothetical protein